MAFQRRDEYIELPKKASQRRNTRQRKQEDQKAKRQVRGTLTESPEISDAVDPFLLQSREHSKRTHSRQRVGDDVIHQRDEASRTMGYQRDQHISRMANSGIRQHPSETGLSNRRQVAPQHR